MMIVAGELCCTFVPSTLFKPSLIENNPILKAVPKPSWQNCCKEKQIPRVNLQKKCELRRKQLSSLLYTKPSLISYRGMKNVWVESTFCNLECIREFERRGVSYLYPFFSCITYLYSAFFSPTLCHDFWSRDHDHPTDDLSYSQIPRHPEQVTFLQFFYKPVGGGTFVVKIRELSGYCWFQCPGVYETPWGAKGFVRKSDGLRRIDLGHDQRNRPRKGRDICHTRGPLTALPVRIN